MTKSKTRASQPKAAAKTRTRATRKKPATASAEKAGGTTTYVSEKSDYSRLPLFLWFPPGEDRTFLAGVLRKTYKAHVNTASAFIRQKLHPVTLDSADGWGPTAERHDVVLPPKACDADRDIEAIARRFDESVLPHKQSLVVYLTVRFPNDGSLQRGWELGRAFALRQLALKRGLATILVQHAPHRVGSANPPHLHLMVLPRQLSQLGFGVFDDTVTNDSGLEQLHREWVSFARRWA